MESTGEAEAFLGKKDRIISICTVSDTGTYDCGVFDQTIAISGEVEHDESGRRQRLLASFDLFFVTERK